jgi:ribose 5-phosphate isomerase B
MKILIASDHAGFELKQKFVARYSKMGQGAYEMIDLGPATNDRTDYPDYADKLVRAGRDEKNVMGVLICGSGQGMAMRANKYPEIRAALCWNEDSVKLSRQHNDANVLCLGSRLISEEMAFKIFELFTTTPFEGGRHGDRVKKVSAPLC